MLNIEELYRIENIIRKELTETLPRILIKLNRTGELSDFLRMIELDNILNLNQYVPYKTGKIVVIGESETKENELLGVAKKLGIGKDRFEFYLGYSKAILFDYKKLRYNPKYAAVLVGPIPHSCKGKEDHSSFISNLKVKDGYPPIYTLGSNCLKITKSGFKTQINDLIKKGIVR